MDGRQGDGSRGQCERRRSDPVLVGCLGRRCEQREHRPAHRRGQKTTGRQVNRRTDQAEARKHRQDLQQGAKRVAFSNVLGNPRHRAQRQARRARQEPQRNDPGVAYDAGNDY